MLKKKDNQPKPKDTISEIIGIKDITVDIGEKQQANPIKSKNHPNNRKSQV